MNEKMSPDTVIAELFKALAITGARREIATVLLLKAKMEHADNTDECLRDRDYHDGLLQAVARALTDALHVKFA